MVVATAPPDAVRRPPPARVARSARRRGSLLTAGAATRGFVAARSAWFTGLLVAIVLTAIVVLAVTALGSGRALLAPAGGVGRSPTPGATARPTATPTVTPTATPAAQPGGGGGGNGGGGRGKGKGKGGG
jgi:uncharacterized membrane protein YgcG